MSQWNEEQKSLISFSVSYTRYKFSVLHKISIHKFINLKSKAYRISEVE